MPEKLLQLSIPEDLYDVFDDSCGFLGNMQNKMRVSLAIGLFMIGEISLAKAADLANLSLIDFMDLLKKMHIPAIIYTNEMLADDIQFIDKHIGTS